MHILTTNGHFIAQVRGIGCRNWRTINKSKYTTAQKALSIAVRNMGKNDKRARALYVPTGETGSWYEPHVAMEARRN